MSQQPSSSRSARFQTTQWTVMEGARRPDDREKAWEHFCQSYWYPVYAYVRRRGTPTEDAADLTQAFFAKLIQQDWLTQVERRESRFSTLLITILQNFLHNEYRRSSAEKRGGNQPVLRLDMPQAEAWYAEDLAHAEAPEVLFERKWAQSVMRSALNRLEEACRQSGRHRVFQQLSPFLSREAAPQEYAEAATALGIAARSAAVAVHRLRAEFRDHLREEVAIGLRPGALVDEELRALAAALRAGPP